MSSSHREDKFNRALRHVLRWEGGDTITNNPDDPGGRTRYGISERAHPDAWADGPPDYDTAATIYHNDYWTPCNCDALPGHVALVLFDTAVNVGVDRAARLLQEAVGARVDGIVGPKTIEAVRHADNAALNLSGKRAEYYASLDMPEFVYGWMRRTLDTYAVALRN